MIILATIFLPPPVIATIPPIREDLRSSGFMNEWKKQLYENCKSYTEKFHTETTKAGGFSPFKALMAKIILLLFGVSVHIPYMMACHGYYTIHLFNSSSSDL